MSSWRDGGVTCGERDGFGEGKNITYGGFDVLNLKCLSIRHPSGDSRRELDVQVRKGGWVKWGLRYKCKSHWLIDGISNHENK